QCQHTKILWRIGDGLVRTWDLGFTAFGGPPVHFRILHQRFVDGRGGKTPWIDEQTYQELFAIGQALPGPGSTKMLFCMVFIHAGLIPAVIVFLAWSLPGAIGMYALSLGVQCIHHALPAIAYAFLSGLNASTVGIVALAAVQVREIPGAIKDQLTRVLVIGGACAGLCYTALWYFPVLVSIGGLMTVTWDLWLHQVVGKAQAKWQRRRRAALHPGGLVEQNISRREPVELTTRNPTSSGPSTETLHRRHDSVIQQSTTHPRTTETGEHQRTSTVPNQRETDTQSHAIPIRAGLCIIAAFFASFIAVLVARSVLDNPPRPLDLFANMYLAGTIIFGGGPVVIPLLREYVVQPGWVSPRDFLIGLAIIQAFPGPNFNYAVFLGALSLLGTSQPTFFGALLGYIGVFVPGITLAVGMQSVWHVMRTKPLVTSFLRGVNATAVGLVFTAVYRLWQIEYLTPEQADGKSLASEPWWVVVSVLTYAGNAWFNVPAPVAIVAGGIFGLCWYGAVGQ
ncbi:chromate transporter, partial [Exophiala viscosa]|uniref:chromate transporter n=1 Tax=Exophiala viscosa TaxID=2486360 RepID=UPI002194C742